ncbi:rhomboid protease ROM7 [Plasmodium berghei]|uniref:Rhomboid protease ROM7 n=2 Tax=Plasmodium berghei TaxID=5821 RepID=A0A509AL16_PLABA|nr:rhomboid protease ROM7 [Plasmodium berghei ANKA]CXI67416.1 rhomboid protease ROM7 [Plasmodium berghei]SCM24123.1 rhomboid protease ROM7 [Plasmodium berghei]SCN26937.1 rhomboid protease ROM7 [Plasmodium berghei]SCO61377.1 rhomboid protease ROM7 [Plasmodium berghei]SCO63358.1 rhomboid protease ROM7 [Plasmodium berghei]|eukprot:XP_034422553.1 rhomboid protease ROM7 [Plasmodium berghei ANKA]
MNLLILFIFIIYIASGNSLHYNKINSKGITTFINTKNTILKNEYKIYRFKKYNNVEKRIYSFKKNVLSLFNTLKNKEKITNLLENISNNVKIKFPNRFIYYNYLFNKCKLDRILIVINTLLYLYLNRVDKNEEKKIFFTKGNLVQIKDEQKAAKYQCNYYDIYKNKNYKTLFSSIFIHKNILHLYFNMSSLMSIYKIISPIYSNSQILITYLLSGFLSNLISYIYYIKPPKKNIFLKDIIDQNYYSRNIPLNKPNKIICGSSSAIYSLYGMYITHMIFFYFKNNYIANTSFLYNIFYSFLSSLLLENVSHFNHILGFMCGFFMSSTLILFDNN